MESRQEWNAMIEEMMKAVESMPPGGDLEMLFEKKMGGIKTKVFEEVLERRRQAAEQGDFPPSGL